MTKALLCFVSVALFSISVAAAYASKPDAEAQPATAAMVDRFPNSWNHADGVGYGKNYWPEAELVDRKVLAAQNTFSAAQ